MSREEIGKRVGKALGTRAINQSTVASWFTDVLPPADIGVGLAAVYDVPAGWLYFNESRFGDVRFPMENPEDVEVPIPSPPQSRRKHG